MWLFGRKGGSGFSSNSTAEEVTHGIDASHLTAIVTGASSGIGAETARVLALRGVHVIMAVRNVAAGERVKEAIRTEIPAAKADVMELDLSSMASVRKFASDFNASGLPLNLLMIIGSYLDEPTKDLFCYALDIKGIFATVEKLGAEVGFGVGASFELSVDKIELQFATNHIGHFLLTNLLLDAMKKTSRESNKEGRIINVSSEAHRVTYSEGIRFDKINDQEGFSGLRSYGQSKLANILHAMELARRLKDDGSNITGNSLHPGAITTNLYRSNWLVQSLVNLLGKYVLKNVHQGAATTCYVALNPQVKGSSGEYFVDSNLAKASAQATDTKLARELWDFSTKLVK